MHSDVLFDKKLGTNNCVQHSYGIHVETILIEGNFGIVGGPVSVTDLFQ